MRGLHSSKVKFNLQASELDLECRLRTNGLAVNGGMMAILLRMAWHDLTLEMGEMGGELPGR